MSAFAAVFPGQGSQAVGMLARLAEQEPVVRETFDEASQALGRDLWALSQEGPEEQLNRTETTQPALLTAGVAVYRAWTRRGGTQPAFMAGHSLGEYTALVAAGALGFADAVPLVADRGRFMQEAVPEGEGLMAAILGLEDDTVRQLCADHSGSGTVAAVNFNAPGQVVVAGARPAVEAVVAAAKETGAKRAMELPVSIPSHCALMAPAAERLAQRLEQVELRAPAIPVVNNVDVAAPSDPAAIRDALVRQLSNPVRWTEVIRHMVGEGAEAIRELGPGNVLCGLNKRIERRMPCQSVNDPDSLATALNEATA